MKTIEQVKTVKKAASGGWAATKGHRGVFFFAVVMDVFSAIPYVGFLAIFIAYPTIWLILKNRGIDAGLFSRGASKKIAATLGEIIAGVFGFSIVPGITVWAYIAITEGAEEETTEVSRTKINLPEYTTRAQQSSY